MQSKIVRLGLLNAALSIYSANVIAAEVAPIDDEKLRKCMEQTVLTADKSMTIRKLEEACTLLITQAEAISSDTGDTQQSAASDSVKKSSTQVESTVVKGETSAIPKAEDDTRMLDERALSEQLNRSNRFVLTPHKRNYILPATYTNSPNTAPYEQSLANNEPDKDAAFADLKHAEFEFQLSVKILLWDQIFTENDRLFLGYTNHSLWQIYNRETSAPFRETNHQPELMLSFSNDWEIFGFRNVLNEFSLNHQSNGQSGTLSRSWNRVMFNSVFEGKNFNFAINPWYRLPEPESKYPGDPGGDDNPDITHYMGKFQFTGAYKHDKNIFSIDLRNNLENENRGAVELGWTFPLLSTVRGYVTYFNGYGHSLIDYNVNQQVVGLGVTFADLF
ncbi:MAG: phospholipase [Moraxellaceae bacterium]|nr:MAG: phospholipase [Moraxellaceae bacterium]